LSAGGIFILYTGRPLDANVVSVKLWSQASLRLFSTLAVHKLVGPLSTTEQALLDVVINLVVDK